MGVRVVLALLGSAGFQGSIKVRKYFICMDGPYPHQHSDGSGTVVVSPNRIAIISTFDPSHSPRIGAFDIAFIMYVGFSKERIMALILARQRYTDDPAHDPYAATNGLFYSHMGWIFYKPTYEKMKLIEQDDLNRDPGELRRLLI